MFVNYEFLGNEPIENTITCLNFKVDKVVFFGYEEVISEQKEHTEHFLRKYCGVTKAVFRAIPRNDLQAALQIMRKDIQDETERKSEIHFDITGGESLILVAFGILSKEFHTPMHMYDIPQGKLIDLDEDSCRNISEKAEKQNIRLTLDMMIEMRGGKINYNLQKESKDSINADFSEDVSRIWKIAKTYPDYWNSFSEFVSRVFVPDENLWVHRSTGTVNNALSNSQSRLKNYRTLNGIMDSLGEAGILSDIIHTNNKYEFRYKNDNIKSCLWEAGSILELHTYQCMKQISDECRVGVHLDWDGVIHSRAGVDVLNEIDVLSLKGYVPTFISCKNGRLEQKQILHALYELDTVAKRFGGKYAKKILVISQNLKEVYLNRAAEMGIEVQ